jgi:hypothetical protein
MSTATECQQPSVILSSSKVSGPTEPFGDGMHPFSFLACTYNLWDTNRWDERRVPLQRFLEANRPDILCLQELAPQACDLIDAALPDHRSGRPGKGRRHGTRGGDPTRPVSIALLASTRAAYRSGGRQKGEASACEEGGEVVCGVVVVCDEGFDVVVGDAVVVLDRRTLHEVR